MKNRLYFRFQILPDKTAKFIAELCRTFLIKKLFTTFIF
jgi:hypothetical protein